MPKVLKSCSKCKKSPNLVTLPTSHSFKPWTSFNCSYCCSPQPIVRRYPTSLSHSSQWPGLKHGLKLCFCYCLLFIFLLKLDSNQRIYILGKRSQPSLISCFIVFLQQSMPIFFFCVFVSQTPSSKSRRNHHDIDVILSLLKWCLM